MLIVQRPANVSVFCEAKKISKKTVNVICDHFSE